MVSEESEQEKEICLKIEAISIRKEYNHVYRTG